MIGAILQYNVAGTGVISTAAMTIYVTILRAGMSDKLGGKDLGIAHAKTGERSAQASASPNQIIDVVRVCCLQRYICG